MIPRLNNSLRNGRTQDPQNQRRRGRAAVRPRSCSSCFSTFEGLCTMNLSPEGQTVNAEFYCNVLRRLREDIRRKRPELWRAGNCLLHDDNAPCQRASVTREFLAHNTIITLSHPPYSPDLALCDFFLFPKMKLQLKVRRFERVEEIHRESQDVFLVRFENRTSSTRSSSGNGAGIGVSLHMETILKGMLPKHKSGTYILVYRSSLGTF